MRKKDTSPIPKNHIEQLLERNGKHANWLADEIGVSPAHISRMINSQSRIQPAMAKKIGDVLGVDPDKVVDFQFGRKSSDPALLAQALTWLLDDSEKKGIELSHKAASRLAVYVHDKALASSLNFAKTKALAATIIDVIQLSKD